ncbi:MAG TPA: alanine racemase [Bdellovibrionales bacterium]|nr:alanine racemase [Pseudobdellovibrionaceae bacterium]HAG91774.1 alanine racemase [Bdellovibrionales bacterium]|tara:strand:+ start:2160 stop:3311 length:1152 start_codon:yes stop_codon:yes gene_type:complete
MISYMKPGHRGASIEIRTSLLKHNLSVLKEIAGKGFFCPMVKANAYGHGIESLVPIAKELQIDHLGVATWDEALELRHLGFDRNILVFSRLHFESEAKWVVEHQLTPVVSRFEDLELLKKALGPQQKAGVHIKFDTGIHRMGFSLSEQDQVLAFFKDETQLQVLGILTHMSHGEDFSSPHSMTQKQMALIDPVWQRFQDQQKDQPLWLHCLNSAAMMDVSKQGMSVEKWGARPGIALFGALSDSRLSTHSVMRVVSQLDQVRKIPAGEGVSYGWTWVAKKDSVVGVVPMGYADGYPRGLSNRSQVLIRGERVPQIGNVCMDYILVDLTDLSGETPKVGEEVVLLGEQGEDQITPRELAGWNNTISYEILTGMGIKKNRLEVKA